jgi:glutamate-1-semialdehyde 2,1-aminomutase
VPLSIDRAYGSRLVDVDGNEYIDFYNGGGPTFLGNSPEPVIRAVRRQLERGLRTGIQHDLEIAAAEWVISSVPSVDMTTFFSSGSEADHVAIAMARAITGRRRIIKFDGHFHGWTAPLYTNVNGDPAGAGAPPFPHHPGLGYASSADMIVLPWNDAEAVARLLAEEPVAAVIMEAVPVNGGTLSPAPGYLEHVRELCSRHGTLLIFDEVITGFRLSLGGAQERLGVLPDITVLAKALASGFPVSAVGATADVMNAAVCSGFAMRGTYNGAAWNLAAVCATGEYLHANRAWVYPRVDALAGKLAAGIRAVASTCGAPLQVNQIGSVTTMFWGVPGPVSTYADVTRSDGEAIGMIEAILADRGILTVGDGRLYISAAITDDDIDAAIGAFQRAVPAVLDTLPDERRVSAGHL